MIYSLSQWFTIAMPKCFENAVVQIALCSIIFAILILYYF